LGRSREERAAEQITQNSVNRLSNIAIGRLEVWQSICRSSVICAVAQRCWYSDGYKCVLGTQTQALPILDRLLLGDALNAQGASIHQMVLRPERRASRDIPSTNFSLAVPCWGCSFYRARNGPVVEDVDRRRGKQRERQYPRCFHGPPNGPTHGASTVIRSVCCRRRCDPLLTAASFGG
jgi:hypothetical protein